MTVRIDQERRLAGGVVSGALPSSRSIHWPLTGRGGEPATGSPPRDRAYSALKSTGLFSQESVEKRQSALGGCRTLSASPWCVASSTPAGASRR